jgi:hypothetical protein
MTDHDPLASALVAAMTSTDYYSTDRKDLWDAATDLLRQRLDAAGYEVRPIRRFSAFEADMLVNCEDEVERLAAALKAVVAAWDDDATPEDDGFDPMTHAIDSARAALSPEPKP